MRLNQDNETIYLRCPDAIDCAECDEAVECLSDILRELDTERQRKLLAVLADELNDR